MSAAGSTTDWIQTYTGRAFRPLDPDPEAVDVRDIAHALAALCRFGGHTRRHYSVAEHSVLVSLNVPRADALWGLLHDAAEAYLQDLVRPVKRAAGMESYVAADEKLTAVIMGRFGLPPEMPASVADVDTRILSAERDAMMGPPPQPWATDGLAPLKHGNVRGLPARSAEQLWLTRYVRLTADPSAQAVLDSRREQLCPFCHRSGGRHGEGCVQGRSA